MPSFRYCNTLWLTVAMLCIRESPKQKQILPNQGIVLALLPLLPSPHRCIQRSAGIYGGEITCSSSPIWAYMARKISCSAGNTKGGAGWHNWLIRLWAAYQACHAAVFPSVRNASFVSSPGRLDLLVKSRSLSWAGEYQPGPLVSSWLCKSRHCGSRSPHMLLTSYFFLRRWKS